MHRCRILGWMSFSIVLSCTGEKDDWGLPYGQNPEEPSNEVSAEPDLDTGENPMGYQVGDAIVTIATYPDPPLNNGQIIAEWVDVAIYDDQYAVQVGVSGVGLVSREDGRVLDTQNNGRGYSVDSDGDLIVVGSRTDRIGLWRFQEGETLSPAGFINAQGVHEKVAVDNELVAVAWREEGIRLYRSTTDVQLVSTIVADNAYAVDLVDDRLLYSDGSDLVLVDVSDPNVPIELDRIELNSEVRDIDFDGVQVALGLGGNGVQLLRLESDRFVNLDTAQPPGTVFSISLDGEELWVASWEVIALYAIQESELLPIAHEAPLSSAMGVAASNGQAVVADWYQSTILNRIENLWGAEVHLPSAMRFREGEAVAQSLWIDNHGALPLEISFDDVPTGFSVEQVSDDAQQALIPVGDQTRFSVTVPSGNWAPTSIEWSSNDPDEATGRIDIRPSDSGEGSLHPDFALPLISAEGLQGTARLSDFQGKVLFLSWWSDY